MTTEVRSWRGLETEARSSRLMLRSIGHSLTTVRVTFYYVPGLHEPILEIFRPLDYVVRCGGRIGW